MDTLNNNGHFLAGTALGGVLVAAGIFVVPVAAASGWTSLVVASGLAVAAALLAAAPFASRRMARGRTGAAPVPTTVTPTSPAWNAFEQGQKPAQWLEAEGVLTAPEGELAGFLRAKLSVGLTPRDDGFPRIFPQDKPTPIDMLALAFAARAAVPKDITSDLARRILDALANGYIRSQESDGAELAAACSEAAGLPGVQEHLANLKELHGTMESYMIALLASARRRGVLANAEFHWLKGQDRGLWYALQNLGRQDLYVEGLAAMDHYRHEAAEGKASRRPRIDGAVEVLTAMCADLRDRQAA